MTRASTAYGSTIANVDGRAEPGHDETFRRSLVASPRTVRLSPQDNVIIAIDTVTAGTLAAGRHGERGVCVPAA